MLAQHPIAMSYHSIHQSEGWEPERLTAVPGSVDGSGIGDLWRVVVVVACVGGRVQSRGART